MATIDEAIAAAAKKADEIMASQGGGKETPPAAPGPMASKGGGLDVQALVAKIQSKPYYAKMDPKAISQAVDQVMDQIKGKSVDQAFDLLCMGKMSDTFMRIVAEEQDEMEKEKTEPMSGAETAKQASAELMADMGKPYAK